jgi:hypothetical protein
VGQNLFSSVHIDEPFSLETVKPICGNSYTVFINQVSEFLLDDIRTLNMEDHPVALGFINNIIKSALRKSSMVQIGRNPLFY